MITRVLSIDLLCMETGEPLVWWLEWSVRSPLAWILASNIMMNQLVNVNLQFLYALLRALAFYQFCPAHLSQDYRIVLHCPMHYSPPIVLAGLRLCETGYGWEFARDYCLRPLCFCSSEMPNLSMPLRWSTGLLSLYDWPSIYCLLSSFLCFVHYV
jgi:hypothetical protein